jgi:hypothetical protein
MLLLISLFVGRALAMHSPESCAIDDLDLCDGLVSDLCIGADLDLCVGVDICDYDAMDLCENDTISGGGDVCDSDAMDLCDDDTTVTTSATPIVSTIGTTTTEPPMHRSSGAFTVVVDATAAQVKSSSEKSLGKILFDKGVGSTEIEAASYVETAVTESDSRRLAWHSRALASTKYVVTYNITAPLDSAILVSHTLKTIQADLTILQDEMLRQFAAAGVTSATSVTITGFLIDAYFFDNTDSAPRMVGAFPIVLLLWFALTQRTRIG